MSKVSIPEARPAAWMSSTYRPRPVRMRGSSFRVIRVPVRPPTTLVFMA